MKSISYDPSKPLLFIHVPKTGGNSCREVFEQWFGDNLYRHYFRERYKEMPPRRSFGRLQAKGEPSVIYGHFNRLRGFGIWKYYPEATQFMTILRDPLEMHLSRFYFLKKVARSGRKIFGSSEEITLNEFVKDSQLNMLEHFPRKMTKHNYRDVIDKYFLHIGFLDQLEESLDYMGVLLNKPKLSARIPHLNSSSRSRSVSAKG